jgi:hypothetical protein
MLAFVTQCMLTAVLIVGTAAFSVYLAWQAGRLGLYFWFTQQHMLACLGGGRE